MIEATCSEGGIKQKLINTLLFGKQILLNPATVFRNMSRQGGFTEPLIFIATMGLITGVVKILVTFYYMANGASVSLLTALSAIIITPITLIVFSYIGAFLLSIIMKFLDCDSNVETAFRVAAYLTIISPIAVFILPIPYIGNLVILGILSYLMVAAAIEVYQLNSNTARMFFGLGIAIIALFAIGSEYWTQHSTIVATKPAPATIEIPVTPKH